MESFAAIVNGLHNFPFLMFVGGPDHNFKITELYRVFYVDEDILFVSDDMSYLAMTVNPYQNAIS